MTDAQLISIAITVLAIFGGVLINNSRLGDISNRLGDVKEVLRAEAKADKAQLISMLSEQRRSLDTVLRMLADIDQSVTRLEARG